MATTQGRRYLDLSWWSFDSDFEQQQSLPPYSLCQASQRRETFRQSQTILRSRTCTPTAMAVDSLDDGIRYVTLLHRLRPPLARNAADASRLETAWIEALNNSVSYFRALLSSSGSSAWKRVSSNSAPPGSPVREASGSAKGKATSLGSITTKDVVVHRRNGKGGEVFRAVVEVDCGSDVNVDTFRGCLATPETRAVCE